MEARARAALITSELEVSEATLACDSERVTATVTADQASVASAAPRTGANLNDLLIDTFEQALSRLSVQRASAAGEHEPDPAAGAREPSEALPPAEPAPTAAQRPAPALAPALQPLGERPRPSRMRQATPRTAEVACGPALESWNGDAAMGPLAEVSYGVRTLSLVLHVEALLPLRAAPAFRALELSFALALRWQPTWSRGARLSIGAGASSLSATAQAPYEPRGTTQVGAGLMAVTLSRPFWLGAWGLSPEGGVRLFAAERRVTLDQGTQLSLPLAVPELALTISRRFE